jgi:putative ABC transport system ATP-binding protein
MLGAREPAGPARPETRARHRFLPTRGGDHVISMRGLSKTYRTVAGDFPALRGVDLDIAAGELVTIVGRSGSGKSTLLNLVAGLDSPSAGTVEVGGCALHGLADSRLPAWRGRTVGIVFQFFQLLPTLTAAENVMLPMDLAGRYASRERRDRALALLERVEVLDQADKLPATLSGGQQQRVAIARALANDPPVVLADEPTGNLDSETGAGVVALFGRLAAEGRTVVVVTHERDAFAGARSVTLADGRVVA